MKNLRTEKAGTLLVGIGNSGRKDDGLGWKFAGLVSESANSFIDCEYRYQLQVEDVLMTCRYDKIIFVDATHEVLEDGYELKPCRVAPHYYYSSHMQSPETILYLAKELYNKEPDAFTLAITGKQWGLGTSLSPEAERNLQKAWSFFEKELFQHVRITA
ncbi:MAG TPA: hydrogenase maturation protease [Chitinophagaceae bacterium]|nr:hydrogenase maturation protease [Chitinophagaceae bacterium]HPH30550.1 hydrogenase maturation protease [Chitinophagaceae bacterium]HPN58665.1 hydrogenase maturation protease [Chitinophagaceae bacterium]